MQRLVRGSSPDVIFHLAAQSLVLTSFEQPLETLSTNIIGTANLLEVLRSYNKTCDVIVVTSDKCYQNREDHKQHIETDHLGGVDPYSASKACAEIVTASYRNSFFSGDKSLIRVASARAGNVIGGGDWALNRLMPDVVRARIAAEPVKVRHPGAIRPWQHVLEPLFGYLLLAERLRTKPAFAKAWNFGPTVEVTTTVADVLESLKKLWPDLKLNVTEEPGPHEASILMLDSSQAATELGWHPRWKVETAVAETAAWYQAWQEGHDMSEFTTQQLNNYTRTDERP
jgi:CDP-glucose 4,6-dehydratase